MKYCSKYLCVLLVLLFFLSLLARVLNAGIGQSSSSSAQLYPYFLARAGFTGAGKGCVLFRYHC